MIKAMFFDMDGTLLNSEGNISIKTRSVLETCKRKGIKLFIATARPPFAPDKLPWDEETMALFDGGLYCNGGQIDIDGKTYFNPVPQNTVEGVIEIALQYEGFNGVLQLEQYKNAFIRPELGWPMQPAYYATLREAQGLRTLKMLLFYGNFHDTMEPIGDTLLSEIEGVCKDNAQVYVTDFGKAIQVNAMGITKGSSVAKICDIMGAAPAEIATFGDDTNDIEMLRLTPNGFAMANGEEVVKESAPYITLDNNSDGIAHAIINILNLT